ncbi:hypothetical protein [Melittangium boletus]|uniref:3-oxoacyl-ACP synthase n=1 Tax=Melittangium boletus DSM 14713 TaxID=1294270 RepID=A0A250I962_9BACT|nr:hypothetical protein [Melittangium boletus]ATB27677.1 hypothetical protein MEBOL_001121 [Melittangium boletus DSM 14713]
MRLAITGLGMLSTLGEDVVTACAALRAGLSRPAPLRFEVFSPDEESGSAVVTGHPLKGIADGYEGVGLYTRLTSQAIQDLVRYAGLTPGDSAFWGATSLYVCISPPRNNELGSVIEELFSEHLIPSILDEVGLPIAPARTRLLMLGHASVLTAIHAAGEQIEAGRGSRALIVGVDSLVGEDELAWLADHGRLKVAEHVVGLMPGQASAAVLVEHKPTARRRQARVEAFIDGVQPGQEERSRARQQRGSGVGLATVVARTLKDRRRVAEVYADLNGEDARAYEWGTALVRLSEAHELPTSIHTPAVSLGDTGAASGAISIAAAVRSLVRGYAQGDDILVWSSSDTGEVASALITRAKGNAE